jgi:hypothetical protein
MKSLHTRLLHRHPDARLPPPVSFGQGKVRWAMAGRDRAKLEEIKRNLTEINPGVQVSSARST